MTKKPKNNAKRWTVQDLRELRELAQKNTPTRVIGLRLGRTEDAVRSKARKERVSLRPINRSPYN